MITCNTYQDATSLSIPRAVESPPAHLFEQPSLSKEVLEACCYNNTVARKLGSHSSFTLNIRLSSLIPTGANNWHSFTHYTIPELDHSCHSKMQTPHRYRK